MVAFYHQEQDTPEVLTIEPLQNVLKLSLEWIRNGGQVSIPAGSDSRAAQNYRVGSV